MTTSPSPVARGAPKPLVDGSRTNRQQALMFLFVLAPVLGVPAVAILGLISWIDAVLSVAFYTIGCLGVTVGYHRYFTHGSFKANRALKIALAIAGQIGFQGSPIRWVADHRRHHAFSDRDGDPHSPWLFGTGPVALFKGFWHAHMGWLFSRDHTNIDRFAPDLVADPDIRRIDGWFGWITLANLTLPAIIGGLWSWSWWGAFTAFLWAGLVRVVLLHHITWSTNSICHMIGHRPFKSRDKATNFWPLAILSMGESWHNSHHADPTCARHGVKKGQIDISARVIWLFEKLGWATDVRWPKPERFEKLAVSKE